MKDRNFMVVPLLMALWLVPSFLLAGCSQQISQQEAEKSAMDFIGARVKFYARENDSAVASTLPEARISSISSYLEGNEWVVAAHVESDVNGTVKKNDLIVKVDAKTAKVTEFNGARVGAG